ncbi:MAG: ABC transporter permease [Caldilineales bacterium]|nr:ABC transporter permease [Caldilineales bacterium]
MTTAETTADTVVNPPPFSARLKETLRNIILAREFGILAFLIIISVLIALVRPTFLTPTNIFNMLRQMSEITIMAVAMTFLITAQELDLSVGSIYGITSFTMALVAAALGVSLWIGLAVAIVLAIIIGLINGLITTKGRIPAFITTLGMLYILRGLTLLMSPWPISGIKGNELFYEVFGGKIGPISVQVLWMLGIVIIGWLVMTRTSFGYHVRATGSNNSAARLSGIAVNRVKVISFIMVALLALLAGTLSFAHLGSVAPTAGAGMELTVIAAVVIGGTALFGGEGTILGTLLGAALLTVVRNGLVQIGGEGRLQEAFLGAIIIVAVLIHTHLRTTRR